MNPLCRYGTDLHSASIDAIVSVNTRNRAINAQLETGAVGDVVAEDAAILILSDATGFRP